MSDMTIRPAGERYFPLSQKGTLLATGLVWVNHAMVMGKPMTGTITQEDARASGIVFNEVFDAAAADAAIDWPNDAQAKGA